MAYTKLKQDDAQVVRRTKVETTYEYVPILGGIIGFWRKTYAECVGDQLWLEVRAPLEQYDRLLINGIEITLPPQA